MQPRNTRQGHALTMDALEDMPNMSLPQLADIEALVKKAKALDVENNQLTHMLEARVTHLHRAIKLPEEHAVQALREFVLRYIERVPMFIEAIDHISREAGISGPIAPLLNIACDYFLSPPELIKGRSLFAALLDEAYLAHRLLEEINDRLSVIVACRSRRWTPPVRMLSPMNSSASRSPTSWIKRCCFLLSCC